MHVLALIGLVAAGVLVGLGIGAFLLAKTFWDSFH